MSKPHRVAVFGSKGQLAVELLRELPKRGYEVAGFDRSTVDITDPASVDRCFAQYKPTIAINPAAYNQVDLAEKEPVTSFQINALGPRNLAVACRRLGTRFVHYSTDYVFDGEAERPYTEDDLPNPLGAYAVSKLAGELYTRAYVDNHLIIRTSGVFGPGGMDTSRGNFVELMLKLASQGNTVRVVETVASPTYAPALAARTADMLDREIYGTFHLGGGTAISWFDWAAKIFGAAGVNPSMSPTNAKELGSVARRPNFSALSNEKSVKLGLEPMPSLEAALKEYLKSREERLSAKAGKI